RLAIQVDPAQALGDRPAVQRAPDLQQRLPEQVDHPRLVRGFHHHQRGVGADQCGKVLQFAHRAWGWWPEPVMLNASQPRSRAPGARCTLDRERTGETSMKTVLVASSKGGVGKTTIATNLAAHAALAGEATVLVDADPQQSST